MIEIERPGLGLTVPVTVGVGGVPVTVRVGVGGVPVTVGVGGVPVTVGVGGVPVTVGLTVGMALMAVTTSWSALVPF